MIDVSLSLLCIPRTDSLCIYQWKMKKNSYAFVYVVLISCFWWVMISLVLF